MTGPGGLVEVLGDARSLGFLGPGPIESHLESADRFRRAIDHLRCVGSVVDLGSGAGLPGLPLALWRADLGVVLLEVMQKRADFLSTAILRLGLNGRVEVLRERAETAARLEQWRAACDLVVARSFGPPAVTAECAAPFLRVGGFLLVAEPPDPQPQRWPAISLSELGLEIVETPVQGIAVMRQAHRCPERYPRRVGIPAKRPLF